MAPLHTEFTQPSTVIPSCFMTMQTPTIMVTHYAGDSTKSCINPSPSFGAVGRSCQAPSVHISLTALSENVTR